MVARSVDVCSSPAESDLPAHRPSSGGRCVPNYNLVTYDSDLVMTWLRTGVPITLIADLACHGGPLSREILTAEALEHDLAATLPAPRHASDPTVAGAEGEGFSLAAGS
jgi:hypothetical protein